jgi:hypothetical protein
VAGRSAALPAEGEVREVATRAARSASRAARAAGKSVVTASIADALGGAGAR